MKLETWFADLSRAKNGLQRLQRRFPKLPFPLYIGLRGQLTALDGDLGLAGAFGIEIDFETAGPVLAAAEIFVLSR